MTRHDDLPAALLTALPELTYRYRSGGYDDEGPHVVFGGVLMPALEELLRAAQRTPEQERFLRRAFDFIERLALDENGHVVDIVAIEIGEHLRGYPDLVAPARPYLGAATRWWVALARGGPPRRSLRVEAALDALEEQAREGVPPTRRRRIMLVLSRWRSCRASERGPA